MSGPILDVLGGLMLVAGGAFVFIGGVGAIRMPDLYTRMHATSVTDTLGSLLILGGLMVKAGLGLITVKLALIAGFLLLTSPVSAYALANAAFLSGHRPVNCDEEDGEP